MDINNILKSAIHNQRDMISTPNYNQAMNRWKRYEDHLQNIKPTIEPCAKKFKNK